jgi:hypothetical protein
MQFPFCGRLLDNQRTIESIAITPSRHLIVKVRANDVYVSEPRDLVPHANPKGLTDRDLSVRLQFRLRKRL